MTVHERIQAELERLRVYYNDPETVYRVQEYVGAMSRAPEFAPPGPDNRFKLLAEFGSAVLCGRDDGPGRGFTFVTWQYNYDRTGVDLGHYYENYASAKEDFALRAGLVQGNLVFTPERYALLRDAVAFTVEHDEARTFDQQNGLRGVLNQLDDIMEARTPHRKRAEPEVAPELGLGGTE